MIYFLLARIFAFLLDLSTVVLRSEHEKDIEILLLKQQLRMLQRKHSSPPRISRCDKLVLAVLSVKLRAMKHEAHARLDDGVLLFKPATVLKWHRELVRRTWTFTHRQSGGRPPTAPQLVALILRLANENPRWGYSKIHGELLKLGYVLGRSTVRDVLKRRRIPPAPQRARRGTSWRTFLGHYQDQMLACDFFTVETAWLKTVYVLFFLELGTRRVYVSGCTAHPTSAWVAQQARQMSWILQDKALPIRFLIRDRDAKFPGSFDSVFVSEGVKVIRTPFRSPKANAFAERWIRSAREECLDHVLIVGERHLQRVLKEYMTYFNHARPHQGRAQQIPAGGNPRSGDGPICCRDVLGGIIHDYYRVAA